MQRVRAVSEEPIALSLHFAVKSASINYAGVRSSDSSQQASGSPTDRRGLSLTSSRRHILHSPARLQLSMLANGLPPKWPKDAFIARNSLYPLMGVPGGREKTAFDDQEKHAGIKKKGDAS